MLNYTRPKGIRSSTLPIAVFAAAVALACGEPPDAAESPDTAELESAAAPPVEEDATQALEEAPLDTLGRGNFVGFMLTEDERTALEAATADQRLLSTDEAMAVIGLDPDALEQLLFEELPEPSKPSSGELDQLQSALSGYDSSVGNCSTITLYGNDSGRYIFDQYMVPGMVPTSGSVAISTSGVFADTRTHGLSGGTHQRFDSSLSDTGYFASSTTMLGWMLTNTGAFCLGSLEAVWI